MGESCHICENIILQHLKFPLNKMNNWFLDDYLHLKYNRLEDEEQQRKKGRSYKLSPARIRNWNRETWIILIKYEEILKVYYL
jgi:hypothetical protein